MKAVKLLLTIIITFLSLAHFNNTQATNNKYHNTEDLRFLQSQTELQVTYEITNEIIGNEFKEQMIKENIDPELVNLKIEVENIIDNKN